MSENPTLHVHCDCHDPTHSLQVVFWPDEEDWEGEFFVYVALEKQPWYKRIWNGLRYIFGYQCKYGHYDELVITKRTALKLVNFILACIGDENVSKTVSTSNEDSTNVTFT